MHRDAANSVELRHAEVGPVRRSRDVHQSRYVLPAQPGDSFTEGAVGKTKNFSKQTEKVGNPLLVIYNIT